MDYKQLTMTFKVRRVSHTFQGLKHVGIEALTNKEFCSLQGIGFFFQIIPSINRTQPNSYPPNMDHLLVEFSRVFEPPTNLPPK